MRHEDVNRYFVKHRSQASNKFWQEDVCHVLMGVVLNKLIISQSGVPSEWMDTSDKEWDLKSYAIQLSTHS